MNKKLIYASLTIILLLMQQTINAQVTIGSGNPPAPYSILEVVSASTSPGGMRIPQVASLEERNAIETKLKADQTTNGNGLTIYYLPDQQQQYWNGSQWKAVLTDVTDVIDAANGVVKNGTAIELGGTMTASKTITLATGQPLKFQGDNTNSESNTNVAFIGKKALKINDGNQSKGKVLVSDAYGNASWLDNTILTTDLTNKRVGIGTASPTNQVEIGGQENPIVHLHSTANAIGKGGSLLFTESATGFGMSIRHNTAPATNASQGLHFAAINNGVSDTIMTLDQGSKNVGIGTRKPQTSAILDLTSSNKGLLLPRVALSSSTDNITIQNPASGLVVYNTGEKGLKYNGLIFWNGTEWRSINNNTTIDPSISQLHCTNASTFPLQFISGVPYTGTLSIPYSNGNGGSYPMVTSFTQNGLTFTQNSGTLNNGNGVVTYSISGVPDFSSPNTISVPVKFLDSNCTVSIGNDNSGFQIGQTKSIMVVIKSSLFTALPPTSQSLSVMASRTSSISAQRNSIYNLASDNDKSKFFVLNGLRMDVLSSSSNRAQGAFSPKLYNTTKSDITYNLSALSTTDSNVSYGNGMNVKSGAYSYNIDGNDDMACGIQGTAEYINVMLSFPSGEWYNCTWYASRDATNHYFFMTAQRLN